MYNMLHALIVEDSEDDAMLIARELRKGGYDLEWQRVCTAQDMQEALQNKNWDIIICDYSMPSFNALDALKISQETGFDLPFIIVSGAIGEDVAVSVMKAGAHDYLMKDNLTRLSPATARELHEAEERRSRRRAEAALVKAQKAESLGLMAGGVAHDFNNLLVALLTQTSLARAKLPADSPANVHLDKVIKAAERAADLTRQMLDYAGCGQLNVEKIDLKDLVQENLELLTATIPKNVQLESAINGAYPLIQGDKGQIQQVIMNLIINAAEAMNNQPGIVRVELEYADFIGGDGEASPLAKELSEEGNFVSLTVLDNGIGMDEATLNKIFDPFFTTKRNGRGLGLAALQGIVRSHKGHLHVTSETGQGSKFTVYLPLADSESFGAEVQETDHHHPLTPERRAVLVIDDEEPIREAVRDILSFSNIDVYGAADGAAGISTFKEHFEDIGLVILDLSMPGMSGEETLNELLGIDPDLRVVISSGYQQTEVLGRLQTGWKVDFLQKPYKVDDLLKCILGEKGINF